MLTCLLVGLQTASYRGVNFDKLREIIQRPTENPADFLGCFTETLTRYTKLDPSSKDGIIILNSHTLILFPNPSLIFEENLNRQRMALKPPKEIL
jgi:Pyruvate/2-oxoacid:ferredoxin oxidoreductase gamma subunit